MIDQLPPRIRAKIQLEAPPEGRPVTGNCWTFTGRLQIHGYGDVTFGRGKHNRWLLHRWTYINFVGPIPDGLQIDHLCRNRACCNPRHLEPVTNHINSLRGEPAQRTHCLRGEHELSGHNLIIKNGQYGPRRECRTCKYASQRRSIQRRTGVALPLGDPRHGITGYQAYACRCDECRAAGSVAWQRNPARLRRLAASA